MKNVKNDSHPEQQVSVLAHEACKNMTDCPISAKQTELETEPHHTSGCVVVLSSIS